MLPRSGGNSTHDEARARFDPYRTNDTARAMISIPRAIRVAAGLLVMSPACARLSPTQRLEPRSLAWATVPGSAVARQQGPGRSRARLGGAPHRRPVGGAGTNVSCRRAGFFLGFVFKLEYFTTLCQYLYIVYSTAAVCTCMLGSTCVMNYAFGRILPQLLIIYGLVLFYSSRLRHVQVHTDSRVPVQVVSCYPVLVRVGSCYTINSVLKD